jgi:hypothetical protein
MGASCNVMVSCEYRGADTTHACTTIAECNGGHWYVTPPSASCGAHPPPCPAAYTTLAAGTACPPGLQGSCDYDQGRCTCTPCSMSPGGPVANGWTCRAWASGGDACPPLSPLAGTACAMQDQFCYYGGFCGVSVGSNYKCDGGYWRRQLGPVGSCALPMCSALTR